MALLGPRPAHGRRSILVLAVALAGLAPPPPARAAIAQAQAAEPAVPEFNVKAVYLYHFTQFVEWPAAAFAGADAPLVIGVLGDDPFGARLDEAVAGERAGNRRIVVRRFRTVAEAAPCHILYLSRSEAPRLEQHFEALRGRPVLTVGEAENFALAGGIIRFITGADNKLRLRINLESARASGLTISSKLLRAAEIVGTPQP